MTTDTSIVSRPVRMGLCLSKVLLFHDRRIVSVAASGLVWSGTVLRFPLTLVVEIESVVRRATK